MASRTNLLTVSFIDNDESEPIFKEGALDVGIYGGELDKFLTNYWREYEGKDQIRDAVFDTILVNLLGRFVRQYGTESSKKLYNKIIELVRSELSKE